MGRLMDEMASRIGGESRVPFHKGPKVMFLVDSGDFSSAGGAGRGQQRRQQRSKKGSTNVPTPHQQLAWLLTESSNNGGHKLECCAILEPSPSSWWNRVTYSFWYKAWCECVTEKLVNMATYEGNKGEVTNNNHGIVFNYKRQSLSLPPVEGIDNSVVEEWRKELDAIPSLQS